MLSTRLTILASCSLVLVAVACGGDKKPAKAPESTAGITESSAKEDMPAPPSKETDATKAPAEDKSAGAAGGMIAIAPLKIVKAKGTGPKAKEQTFELKADGTVSQDGKVIAKIVGDQVNDPGGPTLITLGVDGSLVGPGLKVGKAKFEGDDLVLENGDKLAAGDDGTINLTKEGKATQVGKIEGGASAKRAALIILAMSSIAGDSAAPAKTGGATAKPGTKTSAEKPAEKKAPAEKPAEKKAPAKK